MKRWGILPPNKYPEEPLVPSRSARQIYYKVTAQGASVVLMRGGYRIGCMSCASEAAYSSQFTLRKLDPDSDVTMVTPIHQCGQGTPRTEQFDSNDHCCCGL